MKSIGYGTAFLLLWVAISFAGRWDGVAFSQETSSSRAKPLVADRLGLLPVPVPSLDRLEPAVQDQLREQQSLVDEGLLSLAVIQGQSALTYMDLGEMYHAYEFNDAAEACYRNALDLAPLRSDWNYNLAYMLQSVGRYEEAISFYRRVLSGEGDPYLLAIRMGECYRRLNRTQEARDAFDAARAINPEGAAVLARAGELALEAKEFQQAATLLEAALKKQPAANKLHYPLAMAYRGLGDRDKAREHLAKRGKIGVQPPDPLKYRLQELKTGARVQILAGKSAYGVGRYLEATEAFRKASSANPEDPGARINLGCALAQQKLHQEALVQFRQALRLDPDNVTAHFNLGTLLAFLGDHAQAVNHLNTVLAQQPRDAQAHLKLAESLQQGKRLDEALDHYRAAVQLDPALASGWLGMSTVLSLIHRHAEALALLQQAHEQLPGQVRITNGLARYLAASPELELRDGKRAVELATQAYSRQPDHQSATTLAMAYAEKGECNTAAQWQQTAMELAEKSSVSPAELDKMRHFLAIYERNQPCRLPPLPVSDGGQNLDSNSIP